jgi:hypothetical protein
MKTDMVFDVETPVQRPVQSTMMDRRFAPYEFDEGLAQLAR